MFNNFRKNVTEVPQKLHQNSIWNFRKNTEILELPRNFRGSLFKFRIYLENFSWIFRGISVEFFLISTWIFRGICSWNFRGILNKFCIFLENSNWIFHGISVYFPQKFQLDISKICLKKIARKFLWNSNWNFRGIFLNFHIFLEKYQPKICLKQISRKFRIEIPRKIYKNSAEITDEIFEKNTEIYRKFQLKFSREI